MRVLQASAELFPLLKTGGLADVAAALPPALERQGCDVRLLLAGLPALRAGVARAQRVGTWTAPWGEGIAILLGECLGRRAYLIDAPALYERGGGPYADDAGRPWPDNQRRFAPLGLVAAALSCGLDPDWRPQIVHAHDWHAGLAPAALHFARARGATDTRSVFSVHNLAYQGVFPASCFGDLGLPPEAFAMRGIEFHGDVSFMKAGLQYADRLTTVSPSYAQEIQTEEQGCGLDGLLRERSGLLDGILNGVDPEVWNPARDPHIARAFDGEHMAGKAACKRALQAESGLEPGAEAPLFGIVSRLTEQKGLHLVLQALPALIERGGQLVVLGSGDAALEAGFARAAREMRRSFALHTGYDEMRSHRIFAGCDVTLVPSRYEPCGLTQLYALAYGSLPLVHRVGGLADTVRDCSLENLADGSATGFVFERFTPEHFDAALRRAFALYAQPARWRAVRRTAMQQRFDWDTAAARYLDVYRAV